MNKFFVIFFLFNLLSSCVTTQKNNDFPGIETKVGISQDEIKNDVIEYKFVQWKCYKSHWLNKYRQLAYTVGYFPEFQRMTARQQQNMYFTSFRFRSRPRIGSNSKTEESESLGSPALLSVK